jgi:hypothetical protein
VVTVGEASDDRLDADLSVAGVVDDFSIGVEAEGTLADAVNPDQALSAIVNTPLIPAGPS